MEITIDKHAANEASVKIKLGEADYQQTVDAKIKDYAKKANIKGFRPGKAPFTMVKNLYGTSVLVEEINSILSKSLNDFLKEQDFEVLGDPLPSEEDGKNIDWKKQKDFEFEYKIGFVENIELNLDQDLDAKVYEITLSDKEVNEAIDNIKKQYGKMTNPEVSEENDFLYGDLKADDGSYEETLSLPLSSLDGRSVKKFLGVKKEESISFDPSKAIKGDIAEALNISKEAAENLKGDFTFTVQNINRTEEATLDQELFDKVFGPDQVSSEEEFLEKVKTILTENYQKEIKVFNEEQIKDALISNHKLDLPEAFLKEWLIKANDGKVTEEDVAKEFPAYTKQLTWSLISNKISKDNDIKAEHEDVIEKTKEMIREQLASSGMGAQLEDNMDMFLQNYLQGNEGKNYMQMMTSVQNEKVLDFVKDKVKLKEEKIGVEKFKELLEN
ncbi:trigger factor [Cyclobacterium marinum]|uniref:Trigger factor n=1 Tax=Cyclobacterium marinum (strain ATCC 25205 / DSM 745 / LMG 13164 / NCIMB 1802) TaxID=880070 RepID=G0J1E8_CYCMS|nr:trigger factor [Cyclobacterium marinum]AEL26587.1 trigger factor [Cyclobacterium marinum DSM 745]MBR9776384.1 trigger factor [Cytophagales bacterium]